MGKKNKKEKKGRGKEKTDNKTEKKAEKRMKKELAERGEEDIDQLIAHFQEQDKKRIQVTEEKCPPPSLRCNMTLTPHPEKDELIMFGGEYFNGSNMFLYNELYFYNIKKNEWLKTTAPNAPPPRSAHQAVALSKDGGQFWIFGGEFSSPTQSQFRHYKDLWTFSLKRKTWEKIKTPGGPSARSGHRMVAFKKMLIVFGGFHDNNRDYKYFNDIHVFDLETYTWCRIEPSGIPPTPRSGCMMASLPERNKVMVCGGYSKDRVKRDVDRGVTHMDMFALTPEGKAKEDSKPGKWKWIGVKQSGCRPEAWCGMSIAATVGGQAVCFGGVFDQEEDEESMESIFYNDLYCLELDKGKWHKINLRSKKTNVEKRQRRKKGKTDDDSCEEDMVTVEEELDQMDIVGSAVPIAGTDGEAAAELSETTTYDDGIFKVMIGPQNVPIAAGENSGKAAAVADVFMPSVRINAMMAIKNGLLYLYGGIYEDGDKQVTLGDFYSLDISKGEEWNIIIPPDVKSEEWEESGSSSDEHSDTNDAAAEDEDEEDMEVDNTPEVEDEEEMEDYFERTKDFWVERAKRQAGAQFLECNAHQLKKMAARLCEESFQ